MKLNEIWYVLNEAVRGKTPVMNLAQKCVGLPNETILELADKLEADMHSRPNSYERWVKEQQRKKKEEKLNEL